MQLYTLERETEGFLRDRGSKFLAFAGPAHTSAEVEARVQALKKSYHDARHHCYAWRIGDKGEQTFATDDGEPAHTAGTPILASLRSHELTWSYVVVVRYFGGTKLGVRGLIEAYRTAADEAIAANVRLPIIPRVPVTLFYPYERTADVNRVLHRMDVEIVRAEYTDTCRQTLAIREEEVAGFCILLDQTLIAWKLAD